MEPSPLARRGMCLRIRKKNAEHTGHRGKKSVFQRGEAIHVILSAKGDPDARGA